jgi:hypothetical protein
MNMCRRVGAVLLLALGVSLPAAASAGAAPLSLAPGEYVVDTSALTLSDTGGTIATGVYEGGVAVFSFDSIDISAGAEILAEGNRPLELKSAGAFTLGGFIEASGFDAAVFTPGPNLGGPGGGAGSTSGFEAGEGPGAGGATSDKEGGGGGGGFGGAGAAGGGLGAGVGGPAYGNLDATLQGGSGGAGGTDAAGTDVGGGGGGGAVKLTAASLSILSTGAVLADGGAGATGGWGASGGGSGGGIFLNASTIDVAGSLSAEGGNGGAGGCCGDGGGGGGGRIAYRYVDLVNAGEASVAGGESGAQGTFGHGDLSPQATGAPGVITKTQLPLPPKPAPPAPALTPAPTPAPAPCEGVTIAKGRVTVKKGKAPIALSSSAACAGQVELFMKAPPKHKKVHGKGKAKGFASKGKGSRSIQIGKASFSLAAGETKTIEVGLSAAALKRLATGKALPATVQATTDSAGAKKTTQGTVSLKLAKKNNPKTPLAPLG